MNVRFLFYQRLGAVSVMYVPIDDQHALDTMLDPCIVSTERDVAEEAESHRAGAQGVMARRTNGTEAPGGASIQRHVDRIEDAAGAGGSGIPGTGAHNGIGVEVPTAGIDDGMQMIDVLRIVREQQLVAGRMAPFDVHELVKKLGTLS
jgi:hypothetical protein